MTVTRQLRRPPSPKRAPRRSLSQSWRIRLAGSAIKSGTTSTS